MDPQLKKLITTGVFLLLFFVLGGIYFFMPKGEEVAPPSATSTVPVAPPAPTSSLTFQIKNNQTITFIWKYLPEGTECVKIYRAPKETQNWLFWKKICLSDKSLTSGEVDLILGKGEKAGDYDYYGEAVDGNDDPLWRSPGTPATPPPPPPQTSSTPPTTPPPPGTTPPSSTSTPQPTSTSPTTNPTSTPPTTVVPPPSLPLCPPGIPCYYTPQLSLSGTSTPSTASFWVHHIDDDIELGWQNLPTSTTKVIASRATSENSPWVELLRQQNSVQTDYYRIRFADETLYQTRYYKIDLYTGTQKTGTHGPLLLSAFVAP